MTLSNSAHAATTPCSSSPQRRRASPAAPICAPPSPPSPFLPTSTTELRPTQQLCTRPTSNVPRSKEGGRADHTSASPTEPPAPLPPPLLHPRAHASPLSSSCDHTSPRPHTDPPTLSSHSCPRAHTPPPYLRARRPVSDNPPCRPPPRLSPLSHLARSHRHTPCIPHHSSPHIPLRPTGTHQGPSL